MGEKGAIFYHFLSFYTVWMGILSLPAGLVTCVWLLKVRDIVEDCSTNVGECSLNVVVIESLFRNEFSFVFPVIVTVRACERACVPVCVPVCLCER